MRPPRHPSRRPTPAKHSDALVEPTTVASPTGPGRAAATTRRLFVATFPGPATLDALLALISALRAANDDPGLRWQSRDQLHLTWRFLGDTPALAEQCLRDALARIARSATSFDARVVGWQYWPSAQAPRVLVLRLDPATVVHAPRVTALATGIEAGARDAGCAPERHPFRLHLTLARVGHLRQRAEPFRAPPPPIRFHVDHLALVESTRAPTGSRYTELTRWPLPVAP